MFILQGVWYINIYGKTSETGGFFSSGGKVIWKWAPESQIL